MYIAVSGNLGSGKSTVAQGLARAFNCEVYPRRSYNKSYIEDLFREPARWTTEAQISFMVHKHDEIRAGLDRGRLFVLDRTFDEEAQVFAERFHDDGTIDDRSIDLIRQLAADLRSRISPPSLIVFCDCPVLVCEARLAARPRSYQASYPPDHLLMLDRKLRAWLGGQHPVLAVKTNEVDYRNHTNTMQLARDIDALLASVQSSQMELFGDGQSDLTGGEKHMLPQFGARPSLLRPRRVYLAAPFTARATRRNLNSSENEGLFTGAEFTESIPTPYRSRLTAMARAVQFHGHDVVLPHRDINQWGSRALPASEIARRCLDAVAEADCFIGLIGESYGSHAELAYAIGLGKPALVLLSAAEPASFFGTGMATLPNVGVMRAESINALTRMLKATDPLKHMTWRN